MTESERKMSERINCASDCIDKMVTRLASRAHTNINYHLSTNILAKHKRSLHPFTTIFFPLLYVNFKLHEKRRQVNVYNETEWIKKPLPALRSCDIESLSHALFYGFLVLLYVSKRPTKVLSRPIKYAH